MKLVEKLSDMIEEEIEDAEKYAQCALNYKDDEPVLAETFYKLSNDELGHMQLLHGQVQTIINEYRKEHGEPPEAMLMLYDILHKKHIAHAATVKGMLSLYKG